MAAGDGNRDGISEERRRALEIAGVMLPADLPGNAEPAPAEPAAVPDAAQVDAAPAPALVGEVVLSPLTGRARSNANLTPFQPGQTGNPNGRPKRTPVTDRIRELMEQGDADKAAQELRSLAFGRRRVSESVRLAALVYMINRSDGTPIQQVLIETERSDEYTAAAMELIARIEELRRAAQGGAEPPLLPDPDPDDQGGA